MVCMLYMEHLSTCCCDCANMFVFEYYRITCFSINADLPSHSIPLCLFTNQTERRLNVSGRVHRIQSFYSRNRAIGSSVCDWSSVKWTLKVYETSILMSTLQLLFETILPTNMHDWPMYFVQLEFVIDLSLFVRLYHHSYLDPAACKGVKLHLPRLLLVVMGSNFHTFGRFRLNIHLFQMIKLAPLPSTWTHWLTSAGVWRKTHDVYALSSGGRQWSCEVLELLRSSSFICLWVWHVIVCFSIGSEMMDVFSCRIDISFWTLINSTFPPDYCCTV